MAAESYHLKWDSHHFNLNSSIATLYKNEKYADVVLYSSNDMSIPNSNAVDSIPTVGISAHKFILSSCSLFFATIFETSPVANNGIFYIILPPELSHRAIQILVQYMYMGEATVPNDLLHEVLRGGEVLKIRGLCRAPVINATTATQSSTGNHSSNNANSNNNHSNNLISHYHHHHHHHSRSDAAVSETVGGGTVYPNNNAIAVNNNSSSGLTFNSTTSSSIPYLMEQKQTTVQHHSLRGLGASVMPKDSPVIIKSPKLLGSLTVTQNYPGKNSCLTSIGMSGNGTSAHVTNIGGITINKEVAIDPEDKCCYPLEAIQQQQQQQQPPALSLHNCGIPPQTQPSPQMQTSANIVERETESGSGMGPTSGGRRLISNSTMRESTAICNELGCRSCPIPSMNQTNLTKAHQHLKMRPERTHSHSDTLALCRTPLSEKVLERNFIKRKTVSSTSTAGNNNDGQHHRHHHHHHHQQQQQQQEQQQAHNLQYCEDNNSMDYEHNLSTRTVLNNERPENLCTDYTINENNPPYHYHHSHYKHHHHHHRMTHLRASPEPAPAEINSNLCTLATIKQEPIDWLASPSNSSSGAGNQIFLNQQRSSSDHLHHNHNQSLQQHQQSQHQELDHSIHASNHHSQQSQSQQHQPLHQHDQEEHSQFQEQSLPHHKILEFPINHPIKTEDSPTVLTQSVADESSHRTLLTLQLPPPPMQTTFVTRHSTPGLAASSLLSSSSSLSSASSSLSSSHNAGDYKRYLTCDVCHKTFDNNNGLIKHFDVQHQTTGVCALSANSNNELTTIATTTSTITTTTTAAAITTTSTQLPTASTLTTASCMPLSSPNFSPTLSVPLLSPMLVPMNSTGSNKIAQESLNSQSGAETDAPILLNATVINTDSTLAKNFVPKKRRRTSQQDNEVGYVNLQCDLCNTSFETAAEWVRHMNCQHTEIELAMFNSQKDKKVKR